MAEDKKVLLSVKDEVVKFRVRGRELTAIRNISLDIYENESIAIVGESGSGKSVFTKTFAGMLDSNGFIPQGSIVFNDDELTHTEAAYGDVQKKIVSQMEEKLNSNSVYENGGSVKQKLVALESDYRRTFELSDEEHKKYDDTLADLKYDRTELFNLKQTYDPKKEKDKIAQAAKDLKDFDAKIKALQAEREQAIKANKAKAAADTKAKAEYESAKAELEKEYAALIAKPAPEASKQRNARLAKEIYLSASRYPKSKQARFMKGLMKALKEAMVMGADLDNEAELDKIFSTVIFRVAYEKEDEEKKIISGSAHLDLAKMKYDSDWLRIRGSRIATIFQDPMTSLNPVLTIGKQISDMIIKHQGCSESEARVRAIEMMAKVGIPNPAARFDDYPFQYSGGMRQRIVIAIALSCQPKILICDEPTTALDVTIQAQILQLIKDLQKEFGYTTVFITHDLGVVANIADRVAVLYAGQIVEVGNVEEVFYDPRHPYTWALLSSLPQLAERNTTLYSITGTPPSLYNPIKGDPFAPRNPYCMKIDTLLDPPMFKVTDTHYAKTWLLHPDAPKVDKPEGIHDIHEKLKKAFHI